MGPFSGSTFSIQIPSNCREIFRCALAVIIENPATVKVCQSLIEWAPVDRLVAAANSEMCEGNSLTPRGRELIAKFL
jgi:hypothetical protein